MDTADFAFLSEATETISMARGARRDRDDRIASLVRYKRASVKEISSATGLTKGRVYQIVEQKYGQSVRAAAAEFD